MPNLVRSIDNDCAYNMLLKCIDADLLLYPWGWPKLIDFVDDDPLFKLMEPLGLFCPSQLGLSFFFLHFLLEEDASCCFWVSVQSKIVSVKKIIEDVDTWKIEGTEFHIQSIFQKFKNIRNWVFVLLTPWDVNMPQQGFDDVERAYISFLQLIILAEPLPAWPKLMAAIIVWGTTNLPRLAVVCWTLDFMSVIVTQLPHRTLAPKTAIVVVALVTQLILSSYWISSRKLL